MQNQTEQIAVKVSLVSVIVNLVLSVFKLITGILAHSSAMVSDAFHSASDVFSSVIVIIGVKLSAKKSDEGHPYGHERLECVAAIVLAVILLMTGCFIGRDALEQIMYVHTAEFEFVIPGKFALAAAIVSILTKEAMYWYTRHYARLLDSGALMADAWHHRSDALSSVGALIGIAGARQGYPILESVASLLICLLILKAAYEIFADAINKMVDHSCDPETEQAIRDCVLAHEEVLGIDVFRTRVFGNRIYADIEISIDGTKTLFESHAIAEQVHDAVEQTFPKLKHIMIHVNPV
ncbi:MAG: cation diffusion facilitator family transporter [Oscillospiraceae bacterium]|nr:cation diffusion facilitator family transporter [Oscillospiraceae bacterium]